MASTFLLRDMLMQADALQKDLGVQDQYPTIFLLTALRYCKRDYTGFGENERPEPIPYEEERLRYIFSKIFLRSCGACARMIEYLLKKHQNDWMPAISREEMLLQVQALAEGRKVPVMSVELMLAVVLEHMDLRIETLLKPECRQGKLSAQLLMEMCDREIYDYVIEEIAKLTVKLQQKSNEAAELRDWRPARMFAPVEELESKLRSSIVMKEQDGALSITIPYFFADTEHPMRITVRDTEEGFVAHDNCLALEELSARPDVDDPIQLAERICAGTVCHLEDGRLTICFQRSHYLNYFLQYAALIAHADLYPDYDLRGNVYQVAQRYDRIPTKQQPDYSDLCENWLKYLQVGYDEYSGIRVGLGLVFLGCNTGSKFLLTTDEDGLITIVDYSNSYNEGAILENYINYYEESTQNHDQIQALAKRFGGTYDGESVRCTFRNDSEDAFVKAINRYAQMGVILSQLGDNIPLESEKQKNQSEK
jgi:hypothetical protein